MLTTELRLEPQRIPSSILALGGAYFLYEIGLLYLGPVVVMGADVFSSPEGATLLRSAHSLALGFALVAGWFVLVASLWFGRLTTLVAAMVVSRATFLTLWFAPSTASAWLAEVIVPLLLLGSLFVLSLKLQRLRSSAP